MSLSQLFKDFSLIAPELALAAAGLFFTIAAPLGKGISQRKRTAFLCAAAFFAFAVAFALNAVRFGGAQSAFGGAISLDAFAAFFNSIFIFSAVIAAFFASGYFAGDAEKLGEFLALAAFCATGMMLMAGAVEFVSLFIAFETMSVCAYALAGFSRNRLYSAEAGIKYLVTGGFSSAVMLLGIALLYGATGSLFFDEIAARFTAFPSNPMLVTGAALVLAGFIFKIGAAPFHQWIPDVYHGAPLPAAAFMSVGVKAAAFAVLVRFAAGIGSAGSWNFDETVAVIAVLTMAAGNIAALAQSNVKRMLAYSSVAHAGYALVGIVAYLSGNISGLTGIFYYLYAYAIMNLGAFGVLSLLGRDGSECQTFSDISGLWKTQPLAAGALAVFMFSLAGIPPTIGFFAKYHVFLPAAEAGMHWLVLFALVSSVVSAYYYLKVLVFVFMRPVLQQQTGARETNFAERTAVIALCAGSLLLGVFPMYSAEITAAATQVLVLM